MWCEQQCITSSLCRMQTDEAVVLARHRSIGERDMLQSTCGVWSARPRLVRCWRVHHRYRDLEIGRRVGATVSF